jgi:hypothetical protein
MRKNLFHVAIALVGLGATLTSCSKPTLEEQLAGSYSVTNYDQSFSFAGLGVTVTDNGIDPSTNVSMTLGLDGAANSLNALLSMNTLTNAPALGIVNEADTFSDTLTGTWFTKEATGNALDSLIWVDSDGMRLGYGIQTWDKTTLVLKGAMTITDPTVGTVVLNQDITLVKK